MELYLISSIAGWRPQKSINQINYFTNTHEIKQMIYLPAAVQLLSHGTFLFIFPFQFSFHFFMVCLFLNRPQYLFHFTFPFPVLFFISVVSWFSFHSFFCLFLQPLFPCFLSLNQPISLFFSTFLLEIFIEHFVASSTKPGMHLNP